MDNGHEPATKQDLNQLRAEFQQDMSQLRAEFHHGFDELKETLRDSETKLLQAFYTFAESNQKRLSEVERENAGLKDRLATFSSSGREGFCAATDFG